MKRTLNSLFAISVLCGAVLISGCPDSESEQSKKDPKVTSNQSECLQQTRSESERFEVIVDGDSLKVIDHNAVFNCCATVAMQASVDGNVINIEEVESFGDEGPCDCTCPFELDVTVAGLEDGQYQVVLSSGGTILLEEDINIGQVPAGKLISECGGYTLPERQAIISTPPSEDYCAAEVLDWEYHSESRTLSLIDSRIALNCCSTTYTAVEQIGTDKFLLQEFDSDEGGVCDCLCVVDFAFKFHVAEDSPDSITIDLDRIGLYHVEGEQQRTTSDVYTGQITLSQGSGRIVIDDTSMDYPCQM